MRFKRGSIVEVLRKDELPSGSWCCAEVVCRNGDNYTVQYKFDTYLSDEAMIEIVSRKLIRPFPPAVKLFDNLVPGDVLEMYQNFSWKMATVCKALGANDFVVRLVGFLHEFNVRRSDLRVRQSWQDGKWFVIGKNIANFEEGKRSEWSLRNYNPQLSSHVTRLNQNEEDACSVGSCSITSNDFFNSGCYFSGVPIDAESSDAESVCYGDEVSILPTQDIVI